MEQTLLKRTVIFVNDAVFSNGVRIPMIGFGTYHATDELGQSVLEEALRCGYRSFDTAVLYRRRAVLRCAGDYRMTIRPCRPVRGIEAVGVTIEKSI